MTIYTSFTDGYDAERSDIMRLQVSGEGAFVGAKMNKICPHLFLSADVTVWVDGNVYLSAENLANIKTQLETADIVVMTHPHRNCLYQEAEFCIEHGIGDASKIKRQVDIYRSKRYPENAGLYACGVIARRHTDQINELCEDWLGEVLRHSIRDQISFPYIFRGVKIGTIPWESVEIRPHLKHGNI